MDKDKNLKTIILKYDDGTEKEITEGVVINNKYINHDECKLEMEFANMNGNDLTNIVIAIMEIGNKSGILDKLLKESEDSK